MSALFAAGIARADDEAIARRLEELGAKVTRSGGVVTQVELRDCSKLGRDEFEQIGRLQGLKRLTLFGKCHGLTDDTLPLLAGLTALEDLSTDGIMVSDAGLKPLGQLKSLKSASFFHISFGGPKFTGAGLAHLAELPNLRRLTVAGSPFNDEGLAALAKLPHLEEFRTWHTFQTSAGNNSLGKLDQLKSLHLGQRLRRYDGGSNAHSVSDDTIGRLLGMKSLETLTLDEARLTAAGLLPAAKLPSLKKLVLQRCEIPPGALDQLRAAAPNLEIVTPPMTDMERQRLEAILKQ
jgi:hypothetical protein